jgi:glycosyltransferase involved in cell wall biosynthesis
MQEFCLGLDKRRFRVLVAAFNPHGPRREILERAGIPVIAVSERTLADIVRTHAVDVVHAHTIRVTHLVPREVPVLQEVVFAGGYDPDAAMNLVISQALAAKLTTIVPGMRYGKDYRVLYYPQNVAAWDRSAIPLPVRARLREKLGFSDGHVVFGRVGRAEPSKTDYLVLASAPRMAKRVPNARFLFVGLPWLYRVWLRSKPSLKGRMVFLPETASDADLARFYGVIDVFWHAASRGETFGNVIAEAMTFGKPVITHATPFKGGSLEEHVDNAQVELVDHGVTGLVANDPASVVSAAARMADDGSVRKRFGDAGRNKVERLYDTRRVVGEFERLAESVSRKKGSVALPGSGPVPPTRLLPRGSGRNRPIRVSPFYRAFRAGVYRPVEWGYLVCRKVLRLTVGFDIEKRGYVRDWGSLRTVR